MQTWRPSKATLGSSASYSFIGVVSFAYYLVRVVSFAYSLVEVVVNFACSLIGVILFASLGTLHLHALSIAHTG